MNLPRFKARKRCCRKKLYEHRLVHWRTLNVRFPIIIFLTLFSLSTNFISTPKATSFLEDNKYNARLFTRSHLFILPAVPPDILDYPTSTDMNVREGSNVSLRCAASGSPSPNITWRKEGTEFIRLEHSQQGRYRIIYLLNSYNITSYGGVCECVRNISVCALW